MRRCAFAWQGTPKHGCFDAGGAAHRSAVDVRGEPARQVRRLSCERRVGSVRVSQRCASTVEGKRSLRADEGAGHCVELVPGSRRLPSARVPAKRGKNRPGVAPDLPRFRGTESS